MEIPFDPMGMGSLGSRFDSFSLSQVIFMSCRCKGLRAAGKSRPRINHPAIPLSGERSGLLFSVAMVIWSLAVLFNAEESKRIVKMENFLNN
jgi:hypothetical protein